MRTCLHEKYKRQGKTNRSHTSLGLSGDPTSIPIKSRKLHFLSCKQIEHRLASQHSDKSLTLKQGWCYRRPDQAGIQLRFWSVWKRGRADVWHGDGGDAAVRSPERYERTMWECDMRGSRLYLSWEYIWSEDVWTDPVVWACKHDQIGARSHVSSLLAWMLQRGGVFLFSCVGSCCVCAHACVLTFAQWLYLDVWFGLFAQHVWCKRPSFAF